MLLFCLVTAAMVGNALYFAFLGRRQGPSALTPPANREAPEPAASSHINASATCQALHAEYGVVVGQSWGSLPEGSIETWRALDCDWHVDEQTRLERGLRTPSEDQWLPPAHGAAPEAPAQGELAQDAASAAEPAPRSPSVGAGWPGVDSFRELRAELDREAAADDRGDGGDGGGGEVPAVTTAERCAQLRSRHPEMRVGSSWGGMPPALQTEWTQLDCDRREPGGEELKQREREYVAQFEAVLRAALRGREERLARADPAATVVAIGVSATTRSLTVRSLSDLALFSIMLPSLVKTAEAGYEYWLYLATDVGDRFFDSASARARVLLWLDEHVTRRLEARGVRLRVCLLRFENDVRKPGPVFNFMMAAAADDGADYLYRINDDTELHGKRWTSTAVAQLRAWGNVGVVGPVCNEGNVNILTHDLVHRTHLSIFRTYYPPVFTDWYMDDWMSAVYGRARTKKGPFRVTHHIGQHSTRYEVDQSHRLALERELARGRHAIDAWCRAHPNKRKQCPPPERPQQIDDDADDDHDDNSR